MSHILFLEAIPVIAGGQRVLLDLLPTLHREFEITVAVPGPGLLAEAVQQLGVSVVYLPAPTYGLVKKSWRDMAAFTISVPQLSLALASMARRLGIDLIYANSGPTFPWGTLGAALSRRPIIWHSHNILTDGKSLWLTRNLADWPVVRQIIGTSSEAAAQFKQPDKSTVITIGVDLEKFSPSPDQGMQLRTKLNILPSALTIGLLGDFIPLKRQHVFLQAALQAQSYFPDLRMVLVGAERPTIESQIYRCSLETWLNQTNASVLAWSDEDLVAVFNALDLVVIASTTETGPLVLFQALACGVPVLSTPVGHASMLLAGMSAPGGLFVIDDVNDLSNKLIGILQMPKQLQGMRQTARQLALTHLDLRLAQQRVTELIRKSY